MSRRRPAGLDGAAGAHRHLGPDEGPAPTRTQEPGALDELVPRAAVPWVLLAVAGGLAWAAYALLTGLAESYGRGPVGPDRKHSRGYPESCRRSRYGRR